MRYVSLAIVFFLMISSLQVSAESVVIRKILDSNLFKINGGKKIKLAYIDAPSIMDPNPKIRSLARSILRYAKAELLRRTVEIEYITPAPDSANVRPVRMWRKYLLKNVDVVRKYLENGFGKLTQQSGLSIEEIYVFTAEKAKRKHRGVWNPYLYKPAPPHILTTNLLYGVGSNEGSETENRPYREVLLNTRLFSGHSGFGLRLAMAYGEYSVEMAGLRDGVLYYVANLYVGIANKNIGFEPGFLYIHLPSQLRYRNFLFPNGRLKIGDLKRIYLSLDFLTDFYSPFSFGINITSDEGHKFWLGVTLLSIITSEERWMAAFKSEFTISKSLLLSVQGHLIDDRYKPTRSGFRVGVGFRVPVGFHITR